MVPKVYSLDADPLDRIFQWRFGFVRQSSGTNLEPCRAHQGLVPGLASICGNMIHGFDSKHERQTGPEIAGCL